MTKRSELGREIEAGLREAIAWKRGEIALPVQIVEAMPASRVKEIRKSVAKSPREFEERFGVPARTLEGWEQGRRVDVAAAVLLTVIARAPGIVEQAIHEGIVVANPEASAPDAMGAVIAGHTLSEDRKRKAGRTGTAQQGRSGRK
jgi:putative transcriptional regulator